MDDARKKSFIDVLYTDIKLVNKSRYLVTKTTAKSIWDRPEKNYTYFLVKRVGKAISKVVANYINYLPQVHKKEKKI